MHKKRTRDYSGTVVQWLKIKHLCYVKHISHLVLFKYDLNSPEFKTHVINQTRGKVTSVVNASVQPLYHCTKPLSISTAKYNDLQDLCKSFCITEEYHAFCHTLLLFGTCCLSRTLILHLLLNIACSLLTYIVLTLCTGDTDSYKLSLKTCTVVLHVENYTQSSF